MEEIRKRGRPAKQSNYEPGRAVSMVLSRKMYAELTQRAGKRDLPLSSYMRFALFDFMQREATEEAERQAKIDATRAGVTTHD